ncbi:MAG: protein kinase [Bryobacteraceae bacterium]
MTPERYAIAKNVFETCLGMNTEARAKALAGQDADIREEVESLFAAGKESGDFLATPAMEMRRFGSYQIVRKIGEGGMGTVYEGRRVEGGFEQRVAIKLIRQGSQSRDLLARFQAERQILAGIDHPNICRLLDGGATEDGQPYFVLDYIDGQTLDVYCRERGLSPLERAMLLVPICAAVDYLHSKEILHRDLKPGNIMVNAAGVPKLLDFGIAKVASHESTATASNLLVATPRYASPEQLAGKALTRRSDIYSLGSVLNEVAGDNAPTELRAITARAMQPDPEARFASAGEFAAAIETAMNPRAGIGRRTWIAAAMGGAAVGGVAWFTRRTVHGKSVAVLPFADFSEKRDQEPFCDGITEEIIDSLSRQPELRVVARTSVFEFKGKPRDVRRIASQLNVDTVLEGSVRKQGEQMRITVQHVRAVDGMHLWSQTFDRPVQDVFSVQREISQAVAQRLGGRDDVPGRVLTTDMEAHRLYSEGLHLFNQGFSMPPLFEKAIPILEQAAQRDPRFVLAYTTMADCYIYLGDFETMLPVRAYGKAKELSERALAIDPDSAEAHMSHAVSVLQGDWRAKTAEKELALAMRLNPGSAFIQHWHAHALEAQGRNVEALGEMSSVLRDKDPVALYLMWDISNLALKAGRIGEALAASDRSEQLHPGAPMTWFLRSCIEYENGNDAGVREAYRRLRESLAGQPDFVMAPNRAASAAMAGDLMETRRLLGLAERASGPESVAPVGVSIAYMMLGEDTHALRWIEAALAQRSGIFYAISRIKPVVAARKRDPRIAKAFDDAERRLAAA